MTSRVVQPRRGRRLHRMGRNRLAWAGVASVALLLAGCGTVTETVSDAFGGGETGDFNGDGVGDVAVGIPFKDLGDTEDAGAVALIYGDPGTGAPGGGPATLLTRLPNVEGEEEADPGTLARRSDRFGSALAAGDFDNDGLTDLAVGVPYADLRGRRDVGTVTVVYGDDEGGLGDDELWHQDKGGLPGDPEDNDLYGTSLAVADFNADGFDDLAVGAPFDNDGPNANGGSVNVIFGSFGGLADLRGQLWSQLKLGVEVQRANALFGSTLVTGDFNGDGISDLAAGAPDETWERVEQAGAVSVIYGSTSGLTRDDTSLWRQSNRYVMGGDMNNTGDRFGSALAAGDFNGDGVDDLAVGTPEDDWGDRRDSGTVNVLYGVEDIGITADQDQIWHQNRRGTGLTNDNRHNFGAAMTAGDFNGDGFDDLAVGIPGQNRPDAERAGAAFVAYGSDAGLIPQGSQVWQEGLDGLPGQGGANDEFGAALAAVDLNGDGYEDLIVGARGDSAGGSQQAGGAFLLLGGPSGLSASGSRALSAAASGLGGAEPASLFGAAVVGAPGIPRALPSEVEGEATE